MSLNSFAIKVIKKYQQNKSLIGSGHCKFHPSCSNYAIGCYEKFSFIKASFLTLWRILRCNPFTKRRHDPIPLTKQEKKIYYDLVEQSKIIIPFLKEETIKNSKISIEDYLALINEYCFGYQIYQFIFNNYHDFHTYYESFEDNNYDNELINSNYIKIFSKSNFNTTSNELWSLSQEVISEMQWQMYSLYIYQFKMQIRNNEFNLDIEQSIQFINDTIDQKKILNRISNPLSKEYLIMPNKTLST